MRLWKIALEIQTGEYFCWIEIDFDDELLVFISFFIVSEDHLKDTR